MPRVTQNRTDRIKIWDLPYSAAYQLVDSVAAIPGVLVELNQETRSFNIEMSKNVFPLEEVQNFFDAFCTSFSDVSTEILTAKKVRNDNWAPKRPLFKHQTAAVEFLLSSGGGLLADSMGLGKTSSAIVAAELYARQYSRDLRLPRVIIGPKYLREVWKKELYTLGAAHDNARFFALEGRNPDNKGEFDYEARWYFVHYDIVDNWWSRLASTRPSAVILDEAHLCKNPKSKRYTAVEKTMLIAPFRLALTGTPILNRPQEIWAILSLACGKWTWGTRSDFMRRYTEVSHNGYAETYGALVNVSEIQQRLTTCYIRRTLADTDVELPGLTRTSIEAELTDSDSATLKEILHNYDPDVLWEAIQSNRINDDILTWITRARKHLSTAKIPRTVELAQSILDQGESLVIFVWLKETAKTLKKQLKGQKTYIATGDISTEARAELVDEFQANGGCMIATYGALSVGVTLTKARFIIMHDLDWVPATLLQAEARVYRIGQTRGVTSFWIHAPNTIDEKFANTILAKAAVIEEILKDHEPSELRSVLNEKKEVSAFAEQFLDAWGF